MSSRPKLLNAIMLASSSSYLFLVLNFLGQLALARLLLPEHFAILAIILSVSNLIEMFVSLSVPIAFIQARFSDTLFSSSIVLSILSSITALLLALIMYFPVYENYGQTVALSLILIACTKPLNAIGAILLADLEKKFLFRTSYFSRGIALCLSMFIAITLAKLGFEEKSLIAREIINGVLVLISARIFNKRKITLNYDTAEIITLFRFSLKMLLSRGAEICYFKVPVLYMAYMFDKNVIGLITQSLYIVTLIGVALNPITEKIALVFYSAEKSDQTEAATFTIITTVAMLISLPVSVIIYFYPTEIVILLLGSQWSNAGPILQSLCVFALCNSLFNNVKTFFISRNKNIFVTVAYFSALVVCILMMPTYKVGIALSCSMLLATVMLYSIKYARHDRI